MRPKRLLAPCNPEHGFAVLYHVTSRVVEKRFIFNDRERARFLKLAKDFAVFSGFELVSWCLMSNHFHLLVRAPVQDIEAISNEEMVRRLRHILSPRRLNPLITRLESALTEDLQRDVLDSFRKRIGHLPSYVKAVKQEFTQWFNAVNQREGTLWEGRYHSTLIEDTGGRMPEETGVGELARVVARYIDMNPVRANVEADPKDSDWSSYGAALRGDHVALRGLRFLWGGLHCKVDDRPEQQTAPPNPRLRTSRDVCDRHLQAHRNWLLANVAGGDVNTPEIAPNEDSDPGSQDAPVPRPRGRPRSLTGLSRIRLMGSKPFRDRFGLASVGISE